MANNQSNVSNLNRDPALRSDHSNLDTRKSDADHLRGMERLLKDLWCQYVNSIEKHGLNEKAKSLKLKYLKLYASYRNNKNWIDHVAGN
jgi:hypothetical protein